ncbi:hypothetical protein LINPERHAP2_LOCUS33383 [Linum perenne]
MPFSLRPHPKNSPSSSSLLTILLLLIKLRSFPLHLHSHGGAKQVEINHFRRPTSPPPYSSHHRHRLPQISISLRFFDDDPDPKSNSTEGF